MNPISASCSTIAAVVCIHLAASNAAHADDGLVMSTWARPIAKTDGLNRRLVRSVPFTLGASYVPALIAFIQPETLAVTVGEAEGSVAISFRVQPANIRRGSGLVAIGNF